MPGQPVIVAGPPRPIPFPAASGSSAFSSGDIRMVVVCVVPGEGGSKGGSGRDGVVRVRSDVLFCRNVQKDLMYTRSST
jgi:hypothetical protein